MAIAALLMISTVAWAAPTEVDDADTIFNVGYDQDYHVLFWGAGPNDGTGDCELENGAVTVDFGEDGSVVATDFADCTLQATEVTGPNGQVNHGMFMKMFNSLVEGPGRGCLNRHLAQTGFGKDDQKIKVSDADPEFVSAASGDTAEVDFSTFLVDCQKGKDKDDGETTTGGTASGSHAHGKPESPGKSGDAPGHNKSGNNS